ncbi:MAG TPA: hypothetical protein VHH36_04810, partial [Candidatus Thermoplasmatota archaeon]|nr:hypothetical protein [Candidatus Thermoplasmatota archaeon]
MRTLPLLLAALLAAGALAGCAGNDATTTPTSATPSSPAASPTPATPAPGAGNASERPTFVGVIPAQAPPKSPVQVCWRANGAGA